MVRQMQIQNRHDRKVIEGIMSEQAIMIMDVLHEPKTAREVSEEIDEPYSTVSRYMRTLRRIGLIAEVDNRGQTIPCIRLRDDISITLSNSSRSKMKRRELGNKVKDYEP